MTSATLRTRLTEMGWKVATVRRCRNGEIRAHLFMRNEACPDVDEIRYTPCRPDVVSMYHHSKIPDGWGQTHKFLFTMRLHG